MVARDHLVQLIFRIVQGLGIFPLNGPVDGHFSQTINPISSAMRNMDSFDAH